MITKAKVNLAAVKAFDQAVLDARDYSEKFNRGIGCLDELLRMLAENAAELQKSLSDMQIAQEKLDVKIRNIEEVITKLTAQINDIQEELVSLERELSDTEESFTITDEEGKTTEIPNPAYLALKAKIDAGEVEINELEVELYPHQMRLERAKSVDAQISSRVNAIEGVIYSLEKKQNLCKQLRSELEDVKNVNFRKSGGAVENLKKIEQIISEYLKTKMVYESTVSAITPSAQPSGSGININININRTTVVQQTPENAYSYSEQQIKEHNIRFDSDGHVCEYEGRKYGGAYNSYEERISGTPADNTIFGKYEGNRGESKYIPSGRTVEGIVIKEILDQYGLDGIVYRNGEPDFEVCADTVLKIDIMSEFRYDYEAPEGTLGNFTQADMKCAELWNFDNRDGKSDWTPRDVANYREAHGLTWHEKCDMETMVLVPKEINAYFRHYGGVSECRKRDSAVLDKGEFDE